jgi:hypothetical protein
LINPALKEEPVLLEIPSPPAYTVYKEGAVILSNLDKKQEKLWRADQELYKTYHLIVYNAKAIIVQSIYNYIENTILQHNKIYIKDKYTL